MAFNIMRRPYVLIAISTAILVLGLFACLMWPRKSAITVENAERIKEGMALAEVEAILGGPARDESTGPVASVAQPEGIEIALVVSPLMVERIFGKDSRQPLEWRSNQLILLVQFDAQGQVTDWRPIPTRRINESPFEMVGRLLHFW
jgi:hypothetical protein